MHLLELQRGVLRRGNSVRWPGGIVPYVIRSAYSMFFLQLLLLRLLNTKELVELREPPSAYFNTYSHIMMIDILVEAADQDTIISAMRRLESLVAVNNRQCIVFRPRVTSDQYYLVIENLDGCWSYVRLLSFHKSVDCVHVSYAI